MWSASSAEPGEARVRVMWLGTYDRDYPRPRVLIAGLRERSVDVVEHHRPVWEGRRDKTRGLRALPLAASALRFAGAWGGLAVAGARERPVDAVVAGYLAQPDALPAWCVARARRVPLVVDMMISLADTLGGDRAMAGPGGRRGAGRHRPHEPAPRRPRPGRHRRGRRLALGALRRRARPDRRGSGRRRARALPAGARARRPAARPLLRQAGARSTASRPCSRRPGPRACRRCA